MILTLVAGFMLHQGLAIEFMLFHLFSGGILFGAVYMITDPVTAPLTTPGRLIYALVFAGVTVLIRLFGAYPEGVAFAILIANAFASLIDFPGLVGDRIAKKSILIYSVLSMIFILSVWIGSAGI
jgi:electron transport complex protein RnfD